MRAPPLAAVRHLDLWLVGLGCLAGALAVAANAPWPIRLPIGLVCVLALPGYTLSLLVFRPGQLDRVERAALSFSLSISVVVALAPIIDRLPGGLSPTALVTDLLITTLVAAGLVWLQREAESERGEAVAAPEARSNEGIDRRWGRGTIAAAVGVSVVAGLVAVGLGATLSAPPARATEFFVTAPDGTAASIPREVAAGTDLELLATITSHEPAASVFGIDVRIDSASVATLAPGSLEPGEAWTGSLAIALDAPADDLEIQILLLRGRDTAAYRSLRVTVDVVASPAPTGSGAP